MPEETKHDSAASGINWYALALAIVRRWLLVLAGAVAGLLLAVYQLHDAQYVYAVRMVITPVRPSGESSGSSQLGSLGGLATLAGISVPASQAANDFRLFIDGLTSRVVANQMAKNQALMKQLFAAEWDENSGSWKEPPIGVSREIVLGIENILGLQKPIWTPPDGAQLQQFISVNVQILQDPKKTYLATLEMDSASPQFSADFLRQLANTTDKIFRERDLTRTQQYISYLNHQLDTVTVAEHRQAITNSLGQQEQIAMAANSAVSYKADIFDGPSIAPLPIYPEPKSIFEKDVAAGALLGAALALLLYITTTALGGTILDQLTSAWKR